MSDSHNDDPFAAPTPEPLPERTNHFTETPVEAFAPPPVPHPHVDAFAPPPPLALAPSDPLTGDPAVAGAVAAEPRLALDGTSLWLNRLGEELVAWLKTLASAAVYATLIVTFGFQVARVEGMSMAPTLQDQDRLIVNKLAYRIGDPQGRRHRHALLPAQAREVVREADHRRRRGPGPDRRRQGVPQRRPARRQLRADGVPRATTTGARRSFPRATTS